MINLITFQTLSPPRMKRHKFLRILPTILSIEAWMSSRHILRDLRMGLAKAILSWRLNRLCQRARKAHRITFIDKVEKYLLVDSLKISLRVNSSRTFKLSARSMIQWSYSTSSVGNREASASWPTQMQRRCKESCGIRIISTSGASGSTARWPPHVSRRARKARGKSQRNRKALLIILQNKCKPVSDRLTSMIGLHRYNRASEEG